MFEGSNMQLFNLWALFSRHPMKWKITDKSHLIFYLYPTKRVAWLTMANINSRCHTISFTDEIFIGVTDEIFGCAGKLDEKYHRAQKMQMKQ